MPEGTFFVLLVLAILASTGLMAAIILPQLYRALRGQYAAEANNLDDLAGSAYAETGIERVPEDRDLLGLLEQASQSYDRVVRIVAWGLILTVSVVVAVTGLWPDTQVAIYLLLAVAGVFVLVVHEIAPASAGGASRHAIEGILGLAFVGALVALTGGVGSPFILMFPIVVTGIALVANPPVTALLALSGAVAYLAAIVAEPGGIGAIRSNPLVLA